MLEIDVPQLDLPEPSPDRSVNIPEARPESHPLGFFSPTGIRTPDPWGDDDRSFHSTIPLSSSLPLRRCLSPDGSPRSNAKEAEHFFGSLSSISSESCQSQPDEGLGPTLSEVSLGYSVYSDASDASQSPMTKDPNAAPTRPHGKYTLHLNGLCDHTDDWHRVRTKRGLQFFHCRQCDAMWCMPASTKRLDIAESEAAVPQPSMPKSSPVTKATPGPAQPSQREAPTRRTSVEKASIAPAPALPRVYWGPTSLHAMDSL